MASRLPVEAPEGTAARPITPLSSSTSHSTVGLPRLSRTSRPTISTIALMGFTFGTSQKNSNAFNGDHADGAGPFAGLACLGVGGRIVIGLGGGQVGEAQHHHALGVPVAFQGLHAAAPHQHLHAKLLHGFGAPFAVHLHLFFVGDGHLGDDVGAHVKSFSRKGDFLTAASSVTSVSSSAFMRCSGTALGPSDQASAGQGWVSMNRPATPTATPARASTGTISRAPPLTAPRPPGFCTECVTSNTTGAPDLRISAKLVMSATRLL